MWGRSPHCHLGPNSIIFHHHNHFKQVLGRCLPSFSVLRLPLWYTVDIMTSRTESVKTSSERKFSDGMWRSKDLSKFLKRNKNRVTLTFNREFSVPRSLDKLFNLGRHGRGIFHFSRITNAKILVLVSRVTLLCKIMFHKTANK